MFRQMINALEANLDDAPVVSRNERLLCSSNEGAKAVRCLLEALTGDKFGIFYHDADFTDDPALQEKYEVFQSNK